jgi:hypothetical protein
VLVDCTVSLLLGCVVLSETPVAAKLVLFV